MRISSPGPRAILLLPLVLFCLVLPGRAAAQECEHSALRAGTIALDRVERVHVIAGAGSLLVTGVAGVGDARASGRACASNADELSEVSIRLRKRGSTAEIEVLYPEDRVRFGNRYAYLDLEVVVPQGMPVRLEDGSGSVTVSGTGRTEVNDGSGNLTARDIRGDLRIDDGSGNIEVAGVAGSIDIDDGSGQIRIADVRGSVAIDDGSGDVHVRGVAGSVEIEDGSGELRIEQVIRDVRIEDDGSGSIRVENVGGDFTVDDDGSGDVTHTNVSGRVSIPDDD